MFTKIAILAATIVVLEARQLQVRNAGSQSLSLSVTGQNDAEVLPGQTLLVNVADDWSGSISGSSASCAGACNVRTAAEIALGAVDQYAVSLVNGFNLPIKIVPIQGTNCQSSVCAARINNKCPLGNQVTNNLGQVVACRNSPLLFQALCPQAVTSSADVANVQSCSALSYLVMIG